MDHELNYRINLKDGSFGLGMKDAINKTSELDGLMGRLQGTIAAAFTIGAAKQLIDETTELTTKLQGLDNILKFASKGQNDFANNQEFINKTIEDFKLPMVEAKEGYAGMLAAFKNTANGGELARKTFLGISTAATVLHMNNQQVAMSTKALTDMMSKGTVQAEELKGQLGDAGIKDAIGTAARAMGKSVPELMAVMQKGELLAADFVPKFAAQLSKEYGPAMANAMEGFQAQTNEASNAILKQQEIIGKQLMPAKLAMLDVESKLLGVVSSAIDFYTENNNAINAGIGVYTAYKAVNLSIIGIKKINAWWTGAETVAQTEQIATTATLAAAIEANTLAVTANTFAMSRGTATTYTYTVSMGAVAAAEQAATVAAEEAAVATGTLSSAMTLTPWGAIAASIGVVAVAYGVLADQAERVKKAQEEIRQKAIEGMGDDIRKSVTEEAALREKKGWSKKGQGLKDAVGLSRTSESELVTQFEKAASTATGKKREDLLYQAKLHKANLTALDEIENTNFVPNNLKKSLTGASASSSSLSGGSSSGGGSGGSGKSITVTIQNLVKEINYNAIGGNINAQELERQMAAILTRAVRDFETTQ